MPITAKQFELGIDSVVEDWMKRIHQFLASHRQEAFTELELAREVDGFEKWHKRLKKEERLVYEPMQEAFRAALDKLVEVRAADYRTVRDETYYALGDAPLPL